MKKSQTQSSFLKIGSRIIKVTLVTLTVIQCSLFLLGAYSGYIPPIKWIIPAFLGLFFPILLILQLIITLVWMLVREWRWLLSVLAVWLIALPQLLIYFPINRADKLLVAEESTTIRVLSYNVCAFGFKPHSATQPNAVLQYIKSSGADLVCLQEAMLNQNPFAGVVTKTLQSYLNKDYPFIRVIRVNRGGSTLAILSKHPIIRIEEIPISSWVNGAIAAKVLIGGKETLLINAHLESFHLKRVDGEQYLHLAKQGEAVRLQDALRAKLSPTIKAHNVQANVLSEYIRANSSEGRVIVCGDFNDTPLSYVHRKVSEGMEDAFVERGNGFGFTFHTRPFVVRIDHIIYGKAFRAVSCEVDKRATESDHYPIEAVLTLRNTEQACE